MRLALIFSNFKELFEHPVIKAIIAAIISLLSTPTVLLVIVPLFWTLDFLSGLYRMRKKEIRFSNIKMNTCYDKMVAHVAWLLGVTLLANFFQADFIQLYGFGFVCTTEFISIVKNVYGDKQAAKILKDLVNKAGLDITDAHTHNPKTKSQDNDNPTKEPT